MRSGGRLFCFQAFLENFAAPGDRFLDRLLPAEFVDRELAVHCFAERFTHGDSDHFTFFATFVGVFRDGHTEMSGVGPGFASDAPEGFGKFCHILEQHIPMFLGGDKRLPLPTMKAVAEEFGFESSSPADMYLPTVCFGGIDPLDVFDRLRVPRPRLRGSCFFLFSHSPGRIWNHLMTLWKNRIIA